MLLHAVLVKGDIQTVICPAPAMDSIVLTSTDVLCNLDTNGTAKVETYGGIGPFAFEWTGSPAGDGTDSIYNLSPGFYGVTVTYF